MITILYHSSVRVDAGWRHVYVKALAEKVSPGMAVVREILEIDGEIPARGQSRTGAKRQSFDGRFWASREVGAKKRISSCEVLI